MLENYATTHLYETLGNLPPSKEIEEKITYIAQEMAVSEPIIIKRMAPLAMRILGYYNAFACYPTLLFGTIFFNKPHIFVSEGFFEDLSPEEQRFIIGHELAHIREHHVLYLETIVALIEIFLLIFWWFVLTKYIKIFAQRFSTMHQKKIRYTLLITSLLFCVAVPELAELAYRRRIEKDADMISIRTLKCTDGALKAIARWCREFKIPFHNPCCGIFSDHPSPCERKKYCLTEQVH